MKLKDLIENVNVGEVNVFDVADTGDGTKKLTIESRKLLPEAPRFPIRTESPARHHSFYDAAGFAAYLKKYGGSETVIFANPSRFCVSAVLNERAEKGFEIVTFEPMIHPLFAPWGNIAGLKLDLNDFVDFISTHRRSLVGNAMEIVLLLSQVRATTTKELHRGRGVKCVNGLICTTEIQGENKKELVELPTELDVFVPLFVGGSRTSITFDLTLGVNEEDEITVDVSSGELLSAKTKAFDAALIELKAALPDATVTLGEPCHLNWTCLKELA